MPCKKHILNDIQSAKEVFTLLTKKEDQNSEIETKIKEIIDKVKEHGDAALLEYTQEYDSRNHLGAFKIHSTEIATAAASISIEDYNVMQEVASNIRQFNEMQKQKSWFHTKEDGSILGQKIEPIYRAGIYVPSGRAGKNPDILSLFMGAIPALVAGTSEIAIVTPPCEDGTISPYLLAATYLLDIKEIYSTGGPWSIAALAYGTQTIKPVDIIAGPGNIYVTTAKKMVQQDVLIDMLAGPDSFLIFGDESANADFIAADLLASVENNTMSSALFLTTSKALIERVIKYLEIRVKSSANPERMKKILHDWVTLISLPHVSECIEFINFAAPSKVELHASDPWQLMPFIKNTGTICLGSLSSSVLGEFYAGVNNILPTMSTARYTSGLSVETFTKKINIFSSSQFFAHTHAQNAARFARLEKRELHAQVAEIRKR